MDAVILAGGMGTRLQSVIKDIPKPMADINGKPFLEYLFQNLIRKGVSKFIISSGYRHQVIFDYFGNSFSGTPVLYAIEDEPLGTGGGIYKAIGFSDMEHVVVLNGDTLFDIDLLNLITKHISVEADLTIALRKVADPSRFGTVTYDDSFSVTGFLEKNSALGSAYINGGIYVIKKSVILNLGLPEKFSFEKDFLEKYYSKLKMKVYLSDDYFIDIGIPSEYEKAKKDFKKFDN